MNIQATRGKIHNKEYFVKVFYIENLNWYSQPLIKSLVDSYQSKNYYSEYTLATIAIDGDVNRFNEMTGTQTFESNINK